MGGGWVEDGWRMGVNTCGKTAYHISIHACMFSLTCNPAHSYSYGVADDTYIIMIVCDSIQIPAGSICIKTSESGYIGFVWF